MDGVERAQRGRERLRAALEDPRIEGDEIAALRGRTARRSGDRPRRRRSAPEGDAIGRSCAGPRSGQAHWRLPSRQRPRPERIPFAEDDPQEDGRVEIYIHRSPRSWRSSSSELIVHPAGLRRVPRTDANGTLGGRIVTRDGGRLDGHDARDWPVAVGDDDFRTAPRSTARRCSDSRSFNSAILTVLMARSSHEWTASSRSARRRRSLSGDALAFRHRVFLPGVERAQDVALAARPARS